MKVSTLYNVRKDLTVRLATSDFMASHPARLHEQFRFAGCQTTRADSHLVIVVPHPEEPEWVDHARQLIERSRHSVLIVPATKSCARPPAQDPESRLGTKLLQFQTMTPCVENVDAAVRLFLGFLIRDTVLTLDSIKGTWRFRSHRFEQDKSPIDTAKRFTQQSDHAQIIDQAMVEMKSSVVPDGELRAILAATLPDRVGPIRTESGILEGNAVLRMAMYPSHGKTSDIEIGLLTRISECRIGTDPIVAVAAIAAK